MLCKITVDVYTMKDMYTDDRTYGNRVRTTERTVQENINTLDMLGATLKRT
jgi:hypothetical protein